jgi:hypothetical protein
LSATSPQTREERFAEAVIALNGVLDDIAQRVGVTTKEPSDLVDAIEELKLERNEARALLGSEREYRESLERERNGLVAVIDGRWDPDAWPQLGTVRHAHQQLEGTRAAAKVMREFLGMVARLSTEREAEMASEDAIATVNALVTAARDAIAKFGGQL